MHVDIAMGLHELDLATVGDIDRCLDGVDLQATIRLDFRSVTFCSAGAVRALLVLAARVAVAGGSLRVILARPNVVRVFDLLDVRSLLVDPDDELVVPALAAACA